MTENVGNGEPAKVVKCQTAVTNFDRQCGYKIKKGDKVLVWFVSGNRDEDIFNDPHAFEITRQPYPHMSFGLKGPQFCLDAHLSKPEIRVTLVSLLKRFPGIEAKEPLKRLRSNFLNAPIAQPARL